MATDTEEFKHGGNAYERIKSVSDTVVVVRQLGREFIIEGQAAVNALVRKGYLRKLADVGYVTQRSFDLLVDYHSQDQDDKTRCDPNKITDCRQYQGCLKKYGADYLANIERMMKAKTPLSKYSANAYWARLCILARNKCQKACSEGATAKNPKFNPNWRKDFFDIKPMTKKDREMFGGGAGARSGR